MQKKTNFHLFIPSLIQALNTWYRDFSFEADAPHLSKLLSQFDKAHNRNASNFEAAFFTFLDSDTLGTETKELPTAYYRNQIHNQNSHERLICADPVHLEVGMNDVTLTNQITDLSDAEAHEIISILNAHFKDDGLVFIFGSNHCWYISYTEEESIESSPLDSMLMKNVIDKQAQSPQRNWQVIQNETQMLLHSTEINQHREMAGLASMNSLWFWGAGKPINSPANIANLYYPNDTASKLRCEYFAKAANCSLTLIPDDMNQMLSTVEKQQAPNVLILDQLIASAAADDFEAFQLALTKIDNQIIKPLMQAWKDNRIEIDINCCDGTTLKPLRPSIFKFWLKSKKLRDIAHEAGS